MSTLTPNYKLEKPESTDYYDVNVQNRNWEKIDSELKDIDDKKADLGEDGKILSEQLPPMNYDPAGSAAAVQKNLDAHTSNKKNPHGVTADQVGADPKGSANAVKQSLEAHTGNKQNPHGVTAAQVGAYSKEQALSSATAALFGLGSDAVPDDMFNLLARCGDLYVWKRTVNGETDYPVSPNEDAYEEENNEQQPTYTLGPVKSGSFFFTSGSYNKAIYIGSTPSVSSEGDVSLEDFESGNPQYNYSGNSGATKLQSAVAGKFFSLEVSYSDEFETGKVYFVPSDAQITWDGIGDAHMVLSKYQEVIGHPYVPATRIIESLGKLGNFGTRVRIVTGSYVGNGQYGSDKPNTIVFPAPPKFVAITSNDTNRQSFILLYTGGDSAFSGHTGGSSSDTYQVILDKSENFTWYGNDRTQMNSLGVIYTYTAVL